MKNRAAILLFTKKSFTFASIQTITLKKKNHEK